MKLLVKGGHVVCPAQNLYEVMDILIEDGKITEIGKDINPEAYQEVNAAGKLVFPGFIDMHCHLREPGFEYKEDIVTGTASAAAGGFTSIACMPNTNPVIDNEAVVNYIINKAKAEGYVNVYPIGSITRGSKGEELAEIGELKFAGAVAISDDGRPVTNVNLMRRAMQYASMFDIPVISHCEDIQLAGDGVMNEGTTSTLLGLKGIPAPAEEVMVARDLLLAEYTGAPVHLAHVSTERSVDLVRHAKSRGVKVTCETCPHYFSLTEEACLGFETFAKVNPPLRTQKDVEAIIRGLKDGTIDVIATDHAPHHQDEKKVEFAQAANGLVGFETAVSLAVTYLVNTGVLTWNQLVEKMCINPAKILGLDKGTLQIGKTADITIVHPDETYTVNINEFHSKSKNSPYDGFKLQGRVYHTIVGGKLIYSEKVLL